MAIAIAKLLKGVQGFDNVFLMTNPDKTQIKKLLDWLKNTSRSPNFSIAEKSFSKRIGTSGNYNLNLKVPIMYQKATG